MELTYLTSSEIDKVKWNSCVHYATNGNVFGYKFFLDAVAREWNCLVEGDYESVMPLPYDKDVLGRKMVTRPDLLRELGVYSIHVLSQSRVQQFLEAIPEEYKRVEVALNEQIKLPENLPFKVKECTNYQLLLDVPYEEIAEHYSRALLLNLEKAESSGLRPKANLKPEKVADFYNAHAKSADKGKSFHALQRVMWNILHRGWGFAGGVEDENGELVAVDFFIYSHSKVLSLVPVQSPKGERLGALAALHNNFIKSHENKKLIFDFNKKQEDAYAEQFGAQANVFQEIVKDTRILKI